MDEKKKEMDEEPYKDREDETSREDPHYTPAYHLTGYSAKFWERVEEDMKKHGYSGSDLAARLGINKNKLNRWRRDGNIPPTDVAWAISREFDRNMAYYVTGAPYATPTSELKSELYTRLEKSSHFVTYFQPKDDVYPTVHLPDRVFMIPTETIEDPENCQLVGIYLKDPYSKGFGYYPGDVVVFDLAKKSGDGMYALLFPSADEFGDPNVPSMGYKIRRLDFDRENHIVHCIRNDGGGENVIKLPLEQVSTTLADFGGKVVGFYRSVRTTDDTMQLL